MNRYQDDQACIPRHGADLFSLHGCSFFSALHLFSTFLFFSFYFFFLTSGSELIPN